MATTSHTSEITAPRENMLEYMAEAKEKNQWDRPSISTRDIPPLIGELLYEEIDKSHEFTLKFDRATYDIYRIEDTNYVLYHVQPNSRANRWCLPYWGEACLDLRYWVLTSELTDNEVTITHVTSSVIKCIMSSAPPEWEEQLSTLINEYRTDLEG